MDLTRKKHSKENVENRAPVPFQRTPPMDSLIHPDWELIDPNPNIYDLFQAFDKRFFWNQLGSVEVKWSPRMTSCAGVCTYKGRAGCVVSLSAPLLKLRPRKDLIETLLHEMIHAYLFVTKNFKDRSDHGPKFHKHMHRINAEGGTKITVYHSFHDEVGHYQNHWWRCDGPCQTRKPYFGLVKRSMNRAPGPNDFWFAQHQQTCGGTYVKIKEPEGYKSKNKKQKVEKDEGAMPQMKDSKADLTKYLVPSQNSSTSNVTGLNSFDVQAIRKTNNVTTTLQSGVRNVHGFQTLAQPSKPAGNYQAPGSSKTNDSKADLKKYLVPSQNSSTSNVAGLNSFDVQAKRKTSNVATTLQSGVSNVHGFQTLAQPSKPVGNYQAPGSSKTNGPAYGGGGTGMMSNKGGTLLVRSGFVTKTENPSDSREPTVKKEDGADFVPFSGMGFKLGAGGGSSKNPRQTLVSKSAATGKLGAKIKIETNASPVAKIIIEDSDDELTAESTINCLICFKSVKLGTIDEHLETCKRLNDVFDNIVINDSDDQSEAQTNQNYVKCPCCSTKVIEGKINEHLDVCLL